ncbi:hypothetical protein H5410_060510 [Solanum commersonii]|uniref:Uncharacterized protein n=1 Tax=Solanum commersonii TaxID=4109 RepID=A0A9J5W690_SOLCO|nr:hypothetical protein H5410_060510 [Solanum commersonii]
MCSNVFDMQIPNWFCKWLTLYDVSPKLISLQRDKLFFEGMSSMYFFIEFSIPWIMKWSVEVDNTFEGFPCLQRNLIQSYLEIQGDDISPFKQNTRKLHMKKGIQSKSEAIAMYIGGSQKRFNKNS